MNHPILNKNRIVTAVAGLALLASGRSRLQSRSGDRRRGGWSRRYNAGYRRRCVGGRCRTCIRRVATPAVTAQRWFRAACNDGPLPQILLLQARRQAGCCGNRQSSNGLDGWQRRSHPRANRRGRNHVPVGRRSHEPKPPLLHRALGHARRRDTGVVGLRFIDVICCNDREGNGCHSQRRPRQLVGPACWALRRP